MQEDRPAPAIQTTETFYTVIYRVNGPRETHNEWWRAIQPLFLTDDAPICVTAFAKYDALAKLDELERDNED